MREPYRWDIFCRVVDNFGDAGVCWRLARQLTAEHGSRVRLWIDDVQSLRRLDPAVGALEQQNIGGVQVWRWSDPLPVTAPAEIVVEAFGCGVPDEYVSAMARATRRPLWVVLEYLSAEPWVPQHHGLPSPHPRQPLERYFFFPGFVEGTGGLLREADLAARRGRFDAAHREGFWQSVGHAAPQPTATTVSVFAYGSAPLSELMQCWEGGEAPTVAVIPESGVLPLALSHFGADQVPDSGVLRRGALEVRFIPFLPQARYDELLWACDCNFVRGEDSFVRAQWAARPFAWHVYPQQDRAHWRKLDAFLNLYCEALPARPRDAVADFMRVWNQIPVPGVTPASAWAAYAAELEAVRRHAGPWAEHIARSGSLADNLARYCLDKLK